MPGKLDGAMSTEQLSVLVAELRGIRIALHCAVALFLLSVIFAAVRTYFTVRRTLDRELSDLFKHDAEILFEKNELDELISRCRAQLRGRPNHAYARWYLARALLLKEQWSVALEEFTVLRNTFPDWANSIAPLATEARSRLEGDRHSPL